MYDLENPTAHLFTFSSFPSVYYDLISSSRAKTSSPPHRDRRHGRPRGLCHLPPFPRAYHRPFCRLSCGDPPPRRRRHRPCVCGRDPRRRRVSACDRHRGRGCDPCRGRGPGGRSRDRGPGHGPGGHCRDHGRGGVGANASWNGSPCACLRRPCLPHRRPSLWRGHSRASPRDPGGCDARQACGRHRRHPAVRGTRGHPPRSGRRYSLEAGTRTPARSP
mmetsp:Transcript_25734/g.61980  ORF Transcript_25734/g.61980 Transcript_25734/m.61980 type:complete len:219 (-) Transcript_25734:218-874(-)